MFRSLAIAGAAAACLSAHAAHAVSVSVSCLAGHDGSTATSAIQIRRILSTSSFTITRVRAWDENGGLVADRSGSALSAIITTSPQAFAGTTLTTTALLGGTDRGRVLIKLEITDTRTSASSNAPFLIQSIVNTTSPATRISSYCDGGGFNG